MKLKGMAALCRRSRRVIVFKQQRDDGVREQFLSDGYGIYPAGDLPPLDEQSVLAIFDQPLDGEWKATCSQLPLWVDTDDLRAADEPLRPIETSITHNGVTYRALLRENGTVLWTDEMFFKPLFGADVMTLYLRGTEQPYLVAKSGMFFAAAIPIVSVPYDAIMNMRKIMGLQMPDENPLHEEDDEE